MPCLAFAASYSHLEALEMCSAFQPPAVLFASTQVLIAELLPVVESRLPQEDSPSHLYRAVYTQLCEGGERFPVLVNDELPD